MTPPEVLRKRRRFRVRQAEFLEPRHLLAATPIGFWNFDDAANLGSDSSGVGNDLASFGNVGSDAAGVTGGALSLDGASYLGGMPELLPVGSETYSIAAWIKPNTIDRVGIVGWGDFGGILRETTLGLEGTNGLRHDWGVVNVRATDLEVNAAGVDLDDGQWHHVVATNDNEERAIWLNGQKLDSGSAPLHFVENINFKIGASCVDCDDQLYDGLLDDVAIWNVGLDQTQVAALYAGTSPMDLREAGLISQWTADDLEGTLSDGDTVSTWTENVFGANAVASGDVTFQANELNGHSVVRFDPSDGPDQLRVLTEQSGLAGANDFSVAVVFRASSSGVGDESSWSENTGLIDASQPGITNDWGIALNSNGQIGGGVGGPDVTAYSPSGANFADGQPHVAVFSREAGTLSIWMDDFTAVTRSDGGTSQRGDFDMVFGSLQTNENYFNGDIAEIQIYNKPLSDVEVESLTTGLIDKYSIESPEVPLRIAGELMVDLRATDVTAGTEAWANRGTLEGEFVRIGDPVVEVIDGVTAVSLNSDNPSNGQDDAFQGPIAPANLTGNSVRSIEVWAYNPDDGTQQPLETMVAWGRRGGPSGSNLAFAYGNHEVWGAVGQWGTPDMPWFDGGGSPELGQWHHLVYTFDGAKGRVYADGELSNDESFTLLTHGALSINLGAQNGVDGELSLQEGEPGALSLANVRIHAGVLTDGDVAANYEAGIQIAGVPPVANTDTYDAFEDVPISVSAANGLLSNDTDPNMLPLTASVFMSPDNGQLVLGLDGSFTYTPNPNFFGEDRFSYRANNGAVKSEAATVTINVSPQYDAAVAVADTYVVDVRETFSVSASEGLFVNDENLDGLSLTAMLLDDQTGGQLNVNADGSFTYDPQGALGPQTFTYRVDDTVGHSDPVTVTLLVDTKPVASADSYTLDEDGTLVVTTNIGVLSNDVDADGDPLSAVLVSTTSNGLLTLNGNGSFVYTPDDNFFGSDAFDYRVNDGDQDSEVVRVTLNVVAVNDQPVAVDDTYFGFEDQQLARTVVQGLLANDVDVDGPSLTVSLVDPPAEGTLDLNADGSFTYLPPVGFLGTQQFTYRTSDSVVESALATVTLLINSLDQQIVINEVYYDPPDNTVRTEFVELYNAGADPVDLSSWFFSSGISYTFPNGTVMPPGGYLVVGENPATLADEFDISALGPWQGSLDNSGEEITLRNALADVVDRVDYGLAYPWPTAAAGDGSSMELIDPSLDNNLGGSWRSSTSVSTLPDFPVEIIAPSGNWQYRKGTSEASNPISAWRAIEFVEDATWLTGQTPIGFGDGDDNTELTDMRGNYTSLFLRHEFEITDIPPQLELGLYYDDSAIAWINGVEVARLGVPDGEPTFDLTGGNHEASWVPVTLEDPADFLVVGTNVLAVQQFNTTINSSDASIDAQLSIPGKSGLPSQPSPGGVNSVQADNAPPQSRQADHSPNQPSSSDETVVTLKVTDPDGVARVDLQYQVVLPGAYVPAFIPLTKTQLLRDADQPPEPNPEYFDLANWTTVAMKDDGAGSDARAGDGVYTVTLPPQAHRTLVRYRMQVEDALGASVQVPYLDDSSLNFAYYVYDGLPDYETDAGTFDTDVLESLPVYQFLTRGEDMEEVLAYSSADQIDQGPEARFTYNWPGTMVYNGEVYDNIKYRLRGANGRYHQRGKRSMRFRFNKGSYFQAFDQDGNAYPEKWRTLTTGKGFENRGTLTYSMNEAINMHLYDVLGLPAADTHWVHFRVVDDVAEAPDQWRGDFWGLNFVTETYDVRFLESHGLEKGNLYKLINSRTDWESQQRYQAPFAVTDGSDHNTIEQQLTGSRDADWLRAHVDLDKYYIFHAFAEAIRHYDFWPSANKNMVYYFDTDYTQANANQGQLWILPWDTDATWGPTWNSGHDVVYNGIFPATGGGSDGQSTPELWPEYFNVVREIRDLLWRPDQLEPLIDEFAAIISDFEKADRARWQGAPADAGSYSGLGGAGRTSLDALVQDMKNFAFAGGSWPGGTVGAGGRAAHLDDLQGARGEGNEIPFTPFVSYIGDPNYATDGLAFRTTSFTDPQGPNSFAAMEWRLAKVTDVNAPNYDPNEKLFLEWNADWESGELTQFSDTLTVPAGEVDPGYTYRARVRFKDDTGRWSHWSEQVQFTTTAPDNSDALRDHLRIAEVHFNPLPPTSREIAAGYGNNDDFEFVELVNTSDTLTLDLSGAKFSDGVEFDFVDGDTISLAPGERIVVVEDVEAFEFRYGAGVRIAGQWSGALSNGGEQLELSASDGAPINSFTFAANDDWPSRADGDGSSLVVIDLSGDYNAPENWRASTAIHGTPAGEAATFDGRIVINEVLANSEAPRVDAIELYNPTDTAIDVSGWFLSDGNGDIDRLAKYQIPTGSVIPAGGFLVFDESDFNTGGGVNPNDFAFGSGGDEAWLTAGTAFRPTFFVDEVSFAGSPVGESIGRVGGANGLFAPLHRNSLGCTNGTPRVGPLVITELMYGPADPTADELAIEPNLDADDFEFIEIHNPTAEDADLTDWRLAGGVGFEFFAGTTLSANESLVVMHFNPNLPVNANKVRAFEARYGVTVGAGFTGGFAGRLSAVGERVELRRFVTDPGGGIRVTEDSVVYDTTDPWPVAFGNGDSLNRTSAVYWGSTSVSWQSADATPGRIEFSDGTQGDFTGDGIVDVRDIDALSVAVASNRIQADYDITGDGAVDNADVASLLATIGSLRGDSNLDGVVNASDLNAVGLHWLQSNCVDWQRGDFNGDSVVDAVDLNILGVHWLQTAAQQQASVAAALPAGQFLNPQGDAALKDAGLRDAAVHDAALDREFSDGVESGEQRTRASYMQRYSVVERRLRRSSLKDRSLENKSLNSVDGTDGLVDAVLEDWRR